MQVIELLELVTPVVESCGLEVDRIEIRPAGRRKIVQIFLDGDGPEGRGPSLDEIADTTREISKALDDSTVTGNAAYTLEVSSRGVSRPLTQPKHFRRNNGRLVQVQTESGAIEGRITAVTDAGIELDASGKIQQLAWDEISQGLVQIEMNRLEGE